MLIDKHPETPSPAPGVGPGSGSEKDGKGKKAKGGEGKLFFILTQHFFFHFINKILLTIIFKRIN